MGSSRISFLLFCVLQKDMIVNVSRSPSFVDSEAVPRCCQQNRQTQSWQTSQVICLAPTRKHTLLNDSAKLKDWEISSKILHYI